MARSLRVTLFALATLAGMGQPGKKSDTTEGCLPAGITPSEVVSAVRVKGPASDKVEKTTVQDRLRSLGARCQDGKLVDSAGKEICFFRLVGCWGNPPFNYRDILRRQNEELSKLREHRTVIEITCNPSGLPPE
jgi:hypothetical protein